MWTPTIKPSEGRSTDFHDSSLIDFQLSPDLTSATVVLSTPDRSGAQRLWEVILNGILRLEYESVGNGADNSPHPIEIYDIYDDPSSAEYARWRQRLADIDEDASKLHHVVLASSFICGWGEKESLSGINVICRRVQVRPADKKYKGREFGNPVIPGGDV